MQRHPEFPLDETLIYLNHAAVAPWPTRTSQAVQQFAGENNRFGSQNYLQWLEKERLLRHQFAQLLNAPDAKDIALVKNTSEALSFVAYGIAWQEGDNIVSSNEEFPSNRIPWQSLANQGVAFREADLASAPSPEHALFNLVDEHTRLLTISSIQFASGRRVDLENIGHFCKQRNILFCVDAIQSLGCVAFDVQACQADFVMADGHKWLFGPEGLGVFYSAPQAREKLSLTQYGWHMMANIHNYENKPWEIHPDAQRFECGSPNMLAIHALSASLSLLLEAGMHTIEKQVLQNAEILIEQIQQSTNLTLLSDADSNLPSPIVVFKHNALDNRTLYKKLTAANVICALRGQGVRFSPHFYHAKEELCRAVEIADS